MGEKPIALDAMGGDFAPKVTCAGAVEAYRRWNIPVTLVGQQEPLMQEFASLGGLPAGITITHAPEVIGMAEHAAHAFRRTRESSMHVACELVKRGEAIAAVSAGNSGAFFAVAMFGFGRLPGVDRPALATIYPTEHHPVLVLDVGANTEVRPVHLVQFAVLGSIYTERILGIASPKVGLLSNGEEEEKGTAVVQQANRLLRETDLTFIGNVEGKDVPKGIADVVVSDGFTGNVLIKTSEGVAEVLYGLIRQELMSSLRNKLFALGLHSAFSQIRKKMDYAEYGGAPLLGLREVAIIAHGRSNAWAIANALRVAHQAWQQGITAELARGIERWEARRVEHQGSHPAQQEGTH